MGQSSCFYAEAMTSCYGLLNTTKRCSIMLIMLWKLGSVKERPEQLHDLAGE